MTTENLALFRGIGAKMDYLNQRQRVIAQNISNSDTPGYQAQDMTGADFKTALKDIIRDTKGVKAVSVEGTNSAHIPAPNAVNTGREKEAKDTYEVAPSGNAVVMEEQLINSGQNLMDYNMMANLLQKNVGFIKTSLGTGN
ncbi:MAG: flagellar basal body rod protein FlgB [Micavibrio sp.]|nr:flagellar basal body rod protein FlgB [Micavibrio sp.]|tara:strand:- start:244 stop:666 length:423 start_codon:yes stop_codon:yes gene_type:complete